MVLMREADPVRARQLAEQALATIDQADPAARFDALRVAWHPAYWVGHLSDAQHNLTEQLALAQAAGRKDLESIAVLTRAETFAARLDLDTARALLEEARELAEESGTINSRGRVFLAWAKIYLLREELEQAEAAADEAVRLFSEAGAVWALARSLNMGAWVSWGSGDLDRADRSRDRRPHGDRRRSDHVDHERGDGDPPPRQRDPRDRTEHAGRASDRPR